MDTIHDAGWIKLHRKSVDSQAFQSEGLWKVWTWCLLKANHKDRWVSIRTGRGMTEVFVKRGQFVFGRKTASKELKMKPPTVQKRIVKLKNMQNLITQSDSHFSIITICNYNIYQGYESDEVSPKVSGKYQASITNKNDKKLNNGRSQKKETDPKVKEFFSYWSETFSRETGQPYVFSFGKEGRLVKDLLQVHSLEALQEMTKLFFRDEQCKRRGLTIGIFRTEVNRLIGLKALDPLEQARRELRI